MDDLFFFNLLILLMLISALIVFIVLIFISAPYGKLVNDKWGPVINNKLGWFLMEVPTIIIYVFFYIIGTNSAQLVPFVFLSLWLLHYVQRTLIFPFLIRGDNKMPITIMIFGIIFNSGNAYLQSRWINTFSTQYSPEWLLTPFFIIGFILFIIGFFVNLQSDHIIRKLRQQGENEHKIPFGGLYSWISCPNYLSEITEWSAWALMTFSLSGLTFAIWTFANLAPRALSTHKWYIDTFPNYPSNRKALIPFLI